MRRHNTARNVIWRHACGSSGNFPLLCCWKLVYAMRVSHHQMFAGRLGKCVVKTMSCGQTAGGWRCSYTINTSCDICEWQHTCSNVHDHHDFLSDAKGGSLYKSNFRFNYSIRMNAYIFFVIYGENFVCRRSKGEMALALHWSHMLRNQVTIFHVLMFVFHWCIAFTQFIKLYI